MDDHLNTLCRRQHQDSHHQENRALPVRDEQTNPPIVGSAEALAFSTGESAENWLGITPGKAPAGYRLSPLIIARLELAAT